MSVSLILMAACSLPGQARLPELTVAQIEERILASRRQIRRGKLSFEWVIPDKNKTGSESRSTVWFDHAKGKRRTDSIATGILRDNKIQDVKPFRRIQCRNCERENYHVRYSEGVSKDGGKRILLLHPMKPGQDLPLFDPRLIGFIPVNPVGLGHYDLETVIGKGDRSNQTLRQDRLGGVDCYVIAFDTKGKKSVQRYEYWAAPSKGYALLRVSVTNTSPDRVGQGLVENELERFGHGEVWYPRTSTYTSSRDGKVDTTVAVRVQSAEFNGPPDDKPFTLAGMDLQDGVVIEVRSVDGKTHTYTWENQKLADFTPARFVMPTPPPTARRWWLYGIAGGLSALALAALGLYWWRRPARPSQPEGAA